MVPRVAVIAVVLATCAAAVWLGTSRAAGTHHPGPAVLHVGDTVRIAGTNVGCAVARRDGATTVECLPVHMIAGSYASLTSSSTVRVVRFRTSTVSQTVFNAKQHDKHPTTCR